ncbi:hypothetical protein R1flu_018417 [Riccia fluitans]|uniref:Uncharacterized protein n=1 Tax=Riccia fluitans TaxID=41844 RepID=A0ABD1ZJ88_9MARC
MEHSHHVHLACGIETGETKLRTIEKHHVPRPAAAGFNFSQSCGTRPDRPWSQKWNERRAEDSRRGAQENGCLMVPLGIKFLRVCGEFSLLIFAAAFEMKVDGSS